MKAIVQTLSLPETIQLGERLGEAIRDGGVLCLYGDLGSGKTTLTQSIAKSLGIVKHITSPTFLVMRTYTIPESDKSLYHIDLYRLNETQEMIDLGLTDIFHDPNAIVIIEWSEKLGTLRPKQRIDAHFSYVDEERRQVAIHDYR